MHVDNNFHKGPCPFQGQEIFVHISEPKILISFHTIQISYNQPQPAKKLDRSNEMSSQRGRLFYKKSLPESPSKIDDSRQPAAENCD